MASKLPQPVSVNYDYAMSRPKIPETHEQAHERRTFAIMVRMFRGAVGWSQQDLADQLGLSKGSVAKLELGAMRFAPENRATLINLIHDSGVKFIMARGSLAVHVDKEAIAQLDPEKALSLPWGGSNSQKAG